MTSRVSAPEEGRHMASQTQQANTGLSRGALSTFGIVVMVLAAASPLIGLTGAMPLAMITGNGNAAPAEQQV